MDQSNDSCGYPVIVNGYRDELLQQFAIEGFVRGEVVVGWEREGEVFSGTNGANFEFAIRTARGSAIQAGTQCSVAGNQCHSPPCL